MINIVGSNSFNAINNGLAFVIVMAAMSMIVPTVFYVLRAIGLYSLAKKAKIKGAVLAWFPCVWLYVACRLIKETKVFGSTMGKMAVLFTVVFTFSELLFLVNEFFAYFPLVGNLLINKENIYIVIDEAGISAGSLVPYSFLSGIYVDPSFVYPYKNVFLISQIMNIISYVAMIFELASVIITITIYINLFKKYTPEHFILFAVLSAMGLFGVFAFVIRKKEPVNYMDYIRSRYQSFYGPNGPQSNGNGPYSFYGANYSAPGEPKSPFEDFADKKDRRPEEPFSDFDKKD